MRKFILFALCFITFCSARAYDFECNGFYYNIISLSDLTVELTCQGVESENNSTVSYTGDITVPKTTEYANKTFSVVQINPFAFINCFIGTLTIPETIESIDSNGDTMGMFGTFINLIIEDSETPIKCFRALVHTPSLTEDDKGGDVTDSVYLGRNIDGEQWSSVVYDWSSYNTITFGPKVTSIPENCCSSCHLSEVNIPSNIKTIMRGAFSGCYALTKVQGESVLELGDGAFRDCQNLTSFDFPLLRVIGNNCFRRCASLKEVVLPSGVVAIYGTAFNGCTSLENIVIPSTIAKIGDLYNEIFVGCSSLKTLSIANPTPIEFSESNLDMLSFLSTTLKVPVGAKNAYCEAEGWKNFSNIVEDASLVGDIYTICESGYSHGGSIEIAFEEALEPYGQYRFAKNGTKITINVKPDYGYRIESLIINGVDVASEIVSDTYSFTVTGSTTISSSFTYDDNPRPQEPIYLSIRQADNGCVNLKIRKWDSYSFDIVPAEGWKIHSVSFNGQDMISELLDGRTFYTPEIYENSELIVAFEESTDGIAYQYRSNAKVSASSGAIIVKDAANTERISIYNNSGVLVDCAKGNGSVQTFTVPRSQIYIVKVGDKTVKLGL